METTGKGNEGFMILAVIALVTFVFVVLVGGPSQALSILNSAAREVIEAIGGLF